MKLFTLFILLFSLCIANAQIPDGYKVVTIPLPRGAVSVLGLCHKPDGTLAIATWEGEVWERKGEVWTKFADDLMEPNGILWDEQQKAYYVGQKPELTQSADTTASSTPSRTKIGRAVLKTPRKTDSPAAAIVCHR